MNGALFSLQHDKSELKRRNVSLGGLVEKRAAIGVKETEANIRTKTSRGGFTAVFFFPCMKAIGVRTFRLDDATSVD